MMSALISTISQSLQLNSGSGCNVKVSAMPDDTDADEAVVPDSTTLVDKERPAFGHGQDVLFKHKDGRYYLGTVVEVDTIREQCLVKFGDNTERWSCFKDLTKLSLPDEDLLCVVCKKSAPKEKHEVTVCDKCGRGYHQQCHQPEIPASCSKEGSRWICKKCEDSLQIRCRSVPHKQPMCKENIRKLCSGVDVAPMPPADKAKLPYDPDLLNWDTYHRVNMEQIYCYCGRNGEWYTQMLQCGRCRQWFHEKCVRCLKYPLYCGDRFYVFVCSMCNYGREFVRRLELKWVDMVHLMLFNLTAFNVKKYYDLDTVIIPYVNDNWHALQLPPKILSVSKSERRENILSILTNNRNRFKCGREIKKRTTIWGLRVRLPPPAPCVTLPTVGTITQEGLRERWQGNKRLQFLPDDTEDIKFEFAQITNIDLTPNDDDKMVVPVDPMMLGLMRGTAYQNNLVLSETESPCPSPVQADFKLYKMDYHGGGFVKKSVPFPKISLQRRKRLLSLNVRERDKLIRRQKAKRKLGAKELKKKLKKGRKPVTEDTLIQVPLTPPTSVSSPPTPPASSTPLTSAVSLETTPDFSFNSNLKSGKIKTEAIDYDLNSTTTITIKTKVKTEVELNTPCDTSGDDEASSKSTLDLIIPPPKDFEGKNNPFHTLLKGAIVTPTTTTRTTLPVPLTAVIPSAPPRLQVRAQEPRPQARAAEPRPIKRQLSEKDICIGPNGEVKRRRLRRNRSAQLYASLGQPTASKTAAVVPARPDGQWSQRALRSSLNQQQNSQISNCVDYALNGRRLRQRQEKTEVKGKQNGAIPPAPKQSPIKQEPDISMDDLKSSVNIYFGAANRIASGERFGVKAKRIGPSGKIQYLIEWEGPSQSMT